MNENWEAPKEVFESINIDLIGKKCMNLWIN